MSRAEQESRAQPDAEPPPSPSAGSSADAAAGSIHTDPARNWVNQELELLISAAIVLTLFQLPGRLDGWFEGTVAHVGDGLDLMVFMPYYVAKLFVYGLIATFVLHFLMRSFWVALLGLRTSYPEGIRWERLKLGPLALARMRTQATGLDTLERRVDRMASSLFAFLFVFLIGMTMGMLWAAAAGLVSYGIGRLASPDDPMAVSGKVFIALAGAFALLSMAVAWVDRRLAADKAVPGWLATAADKVLAVTTSGGPNRVYLPIFLTLSSSRVSRTKLNVLMLAFIYALIGVFLVGLLFDRGVISVDSYSYYPDRADRLGMAARHYDPMRPADDRVRAPTLSSDLATGPYLRLFLPYDVAEDNPRIAALCPELEPLHGEGLRKRRREAPEDDRLTAVLACVDDLYAVELDGEELDGVDWTFFTHPAGEVPGWLTYLPTADLAPGRHLLVVRHRPLPEEARDEDDADDESADEHFLPFWR